jgi:hypothetical protein
VLFLCLAASEAVPKWRPVVWVLFASGQAPLAAIVTKRRLRITFPVDWAWVDVLTVFVVPWFGAALWYHEWKKVQENPTLCRTHAQRWASQSTGVRWVCILVLATCVALLLIRTLLSR